MSTKSVQRWIGIGVGLLFILLGHSDLLVLVERRTEDYRFRVLSRALPAPTNVVVVALDDLSFKRLEPELGRWPWPRDVLARVIHAARSARAVALDILLSERDLQRPESDLALVEACRSHGRVIFAAMLSDDAEGGDAMERLGTRRDGGRIGQIERKGALIPFDELASVALHIGFINILLDDDGVLRALPAFGYAGAYELQAFSLAVLRAIGLDLHLLDSRSLRVGHRVFPLDRYGRFLLAPRSEAPSVISIADVLEMSPREAAECFQDRIVFIGSTATGLQDDQFYSIHGRMQPGVISWAQGCEQLITGPPLRRLPAWTALLLIGSIISARLAFFTDRPRDLLLFAFCACAGVFALGAGFLWAWGWLMPVAAPTLAVLGMTAAESVCAWGREWIRRRELEDMEAVKQQLTDMMVHDLRNQAGPVLMALSLIEEQAAARNDQDDVELCKTASASAGRLVALVDTLLDIRRMEEGRMPINRADYSLRALAKEVASEFQPAARRVGSRIDVTPEETADAITARIDEHLMRRVLNNLVWNAIKYGRPGEPIELAIGRAEDTSWIAIGNRGDPIPPEDQESLFQPFRVIVRTSAISRFKGTGLGLAFCRMAVDAHGGRITLESPWPPYGDGVRVKISIPQDPESVQSTR